MKRTVFFVGCLLLLGLRALAQEEALEFLQAEIQRTAQQRDEAQKKLLQTESLSAEKLKLLNQEQAELQRSLNQRSRELLELKAGTRMSKAAMERVERELQERESQIEALQQAQEMSLKNFEEATRQLSEQLAEAQLQALDVAGPEAAKLAEERERLRQEVQSQGQQLLDMEAARQRDLNELSELRQLNRQLTQDLDASRRGEALANAKLAALESRLGNLQQELANQYQERSELEQEKERLEGIIVTLQKDVEQLQNQNESLQVNERGLVRKVDELEGKLDETSSENRQLTQENRQLKRDLREEQKIRERLSKEIASLEEILQEAKAAGIEEADLEDVALVVAEMAREKEAFREEALQHRKNVDLLQAELDNQNSSQRQQIQDLQVMLGQQLSEITASQKKIERLEARSATLENVRKQKAQLVSLQNKSREDMRTLAKHIYDLRSELLQNKETQRKAILAIQKNQELANELGALRAEMERIRRMNLSAQDHEAGKNEQMRRMRQELEIGRARGQALEQEKRALQLELQNLRRALMERTP